MIVGFIGFGKVAATLTKLINSSDIEFITSAEKRSPKTIENIRKENVKVLDTFKRVCQNSDILISANSPAIALDISKKYAKCCKGIYLDLNNISPKTTVEISKIADNFVDGVIIGKIDSENPTLFLSGKSANKLLFLDEFLNVKVLSEEIGDASRLKLLRSTYTKALSAVLIESYDLSRKYDLENEFFDVLTLSEGDDFKENALSRINNTNNNLKRKKEELSEIMDYFGDDLEMIKAAYRKFSQ